MSGGKGDVVLRPNEGQLSTLLASAGGSQDPNIELLRVSENIQKLTQATDALVARDFFLREEESILDDLDACITSLEGEVNEAEIQTEELGKKSSLLRPGKRRAVVGENGEVSLLWATYGETMGRLVKQHSRRLEELENALATASTEISELPSLKLQPLKPLGKTSTFTATEGNVSKK